MNSQSVRRHALFLAGVFEQLSCKGLALPDRRQPTHDAPAENIDHDIETEPRSLHRTSQFRDVPGVDLVRSGRNQGRLLAFLASRLVSSFPDLIVLSKNAVHRRDRAEADAFVKQGIVDLPWGEIHKPFSLKESENLRSFVLRERVRQDGSIELEFELFRFLHPIVGRYAHLDRIARRSHSCNVRRLPNEGQDQSFV